MTASGTTVYPGLYRARCTADDGLLLTVFVPQVFGATSITTTDYTGQRPLPGTWGYVSFEGGDSAFPVWISSGGGGGGSGSAGGATGPGVASVDTYGDFVLALPDLWAYWRLGERGLGRHGLLALDSSGFGRHAYYRTTHWGRYGPIPYGDVGNIGTIDPADLDGLTLGIPALPNGTSDTAARFINQLAWVEYPNWPWHLQFTVAWWATITHDDPDPYYDITMMIHHTANSGDYDESSAWIEDQYAAEDKVWYVNPFNNGTQWDAAFAPGGTPSGGPFDYGVRHLFVVRQTAPNIIGSASGSIDADTASHFVTVGAWDSDRFYVPGEIVTHVTGGWQLCLRQNINVLPADDGTIWEALSFDTTVLDLSLDGVLINTGGPGYGSTPGIPSFDWLRFGQPPNDDDWRIATGPINTSDFDEVVVLSRPITDDEVAGMLLAGIG